MFSHNGVSGGETLSPASKKKYDEDRAILAWLLFNELDDLFAPYVKEKYEILSQLTGVHMTVNLFAVPQRSLEINSGVLTKTLDIKYGDLPAILFIDSYLDTDQTALYSFRATDRASLTREFYFVFDLVNDAWSRSAADHGDDTMDGLLVRRRNCINIMEPRIRLKRLSDFTKRNGSSILSAVSELSKFVFPGK